MQGTVIKSTGSWYTVLSEEGSVFECRIRGLFRMKELKTTNPVAVGDIVHVDFENDGTGVITEIETRKNYLVRKSTNLSRQYHILASNIDRAFLIATISQPRTSSGFIDRFLVTTGTYRIPSYVIFNKKDLYDEKDLRKAGEWMKIYEDAGYECLLVSALDDNDVKRLRTLMSEGVSLLSGHSGSGKSTLLNKIDPSLNLKTGKISSAHSKGMHTTTFAELFVMENGGRIIDTPGIKELGIVEIGKSELSHFFPEMLKYLNDCRFSNCIHVNEPGCKVKEHVESGDISEMRYLNYLNMLETLA